MDSGFSSSSYISRASLFYHIYYFDNYVLFTLCYVTLETYLTYPCISRGIITEPILAINVYLHPALVFLKKPQLYCKIFSIYITTCIARHNLNKLLLLTIEVIINLNLKWECSKTKKIKDHLNNIINTVL